MIDLTSLSMPSAGGRAVENVPARPLLALPALVRLLEARIAAQAAQRFALVLVRVNDPRLGPIGLVAGERLLRWLSAHPSHEFGSMETLPTASGQVALILPGVRNEEQALAVARRVELALREFNAERPAESPLKATIGVAIYPSHGDTADVIVQRADVALQLALQYAEPIRMASRASPDARDTLRLRQSLEQAIEQGELELHFQPRVSLSDRRAIGVEAISRWISTEHGPVSAEVFVGLAEATGLIRILTIWSLDLALKGIDSLRGVWPEPCVVVRLSTEMLSEPDLVRLIGDALNRWNVPARQLTLELAANALLVDSNRCRATLHALRECGVRLSIDQIGAAGVSSVNLGDLHVSELKIEQSLIRSMAGNAHATRVAQSVIELAHRFRLQVVADGVEDRATCDNLRALGCDAAQGRFICRPLPISALRAWLVHPVWAGDRDSSNTLKSSP